AAGDRHPLERRRSRTDRSAIVIEPAQRQPVDPGAARAAFDGTHQARVLRAGWRSIEMTTKKSKQFRSWMFVPGNRDRFIQKAKTSPADAILLDLEDGVLPAEKADARRMVAAALGETWAASAPSRYVRVNARTTPWLNDDLETVVVPGIDGIC